MLVTWCDPYVWLAILIQSVTGYILDLSIDMHTSYKEKAMCCVFSVYIIQMLRICTLGKRCRRPTWRWQRRGQRELLVQVYFCVLVHTWLNAWHFVVYKCWCFFVFFFISPCLRNDCPDQDSGPVPTGHGWSPILLHYQKQENRCVNLCVENTSNLWFVRLCITYKIHILSKLVHIRDTFLFLSSSRVHPLHGQSHDSWDHRSQRPWLWLHVTVTWGHTVSANQILTS